MAQREFEYHVCDVFTNRPLEGNQLAVFPDAAGLNDTAMQAIARETNLSETTFVLRRNAETERERGVRVRIFTTREELPFAGHPTLGTAATIRRIVPAYLNAKKIILDLNAGRVPVAFPPEKNIGDGSYGVMTQPEPVFGSTHEFATIAPLLGLHEDDGARGPAAQTVSTGIPYCIVLLRSVDALARLRVDLVASEQYFQSSDAKFFYAIAQENPHVWRARMQFYNGEDPATGSAAGCAISYLVHHGIAMPEEEIHIRQGVEILRPSDLYASANSISGKITDVRLGGSTVHVANGRLFLE
ncbi:MAG: PhzF family phenazine biosynthesis protein [Deltaproteobacteria bacterium]|nr:PhzF family phenazine biosynthesis protein [Deltaproteobacteria bacterium]